MAEDLFGDLPPPSHHQEQPQPPQKSLKFTEVNNSPSNPPISLPNPPLKSALKRPKPPQSASPNNNDGGSEKKLRFKTTTDASVSQIVEAMRKITSHIGNPAKFSKASKLAIQLIQAGSVRPETADAFFAVLEAAMLSTTSCNDATVRSDYHALFSAAQDAKDFLNKQQKLQLHAWTIHAVVANDLYTDDSFVDGWIDGWIRF